MKSWNLPHMIWQLQLMFIIVQLVESHQHVTTGNVQVEQFKYYRVLMEGNVRLELHSDKGDADLYVSDTTMEPTIWNFDISATSCGIDIVDIPTHFHRPVGVGVYGYPIFKNATFTLIVSQLPDDKNTNLWKNNFEELYTAYEKGFKINYDTLEVESKSHKHQSSSDDDDDNDDPLWWKILITLLKIVVDAAV